MTINEHFIITLRVAGRSYKLKVKRKDEIIFRDAADEIEKKIYQYRNYFSNTGHNKAEDIDYVLMTSIQAVSENVDLETKNKIFEDGIKALTKELEEYLNNR